MKHIIAEFALINLKSLMEFTVANTSIVTHTATMPYVLLIMVIKRMIMITLKNLAKKKVPDVALIIYWK